MLPRNSAFYHCGNAEIDLKATEHKSALDAKASLAWLEQAEMSKRMPETQNRCVSLSKRNRGG
jgi:hypothetical protein